MPNIEQDLGIEGLRRRKLAENPAFLIEKYVVRRDGADQRPATSRSSLLQLDAG